MAGLNALGDAGGLSPVACDADSALCLAWVAALSAWLAEVWAFAAASSVCLS